MALAHSPAIITQNLVLCLDAANPKSYPGSGTAWTDLSGNSNNGTLVNGVGYSGSNLGSLSFDGVDDYVTASRPSSIVTGGSITISIWAKWTTGGETSQTLVDNNEFSSRPPQGFRLHDIPDINKRLSFTTNGSTLQSTFQVGDGTWRYVVVTVDTSTMKMYIDGAVNSTTSVSGLATVQPNITIGYRQTGFSDYFSGNIAQVSIYNRALTAQEIQQNFNALKGRFGLT
jgi:hypothetical protein